MKIGIDISQTAFEGTGVAEYTKKLVETILKLDAENEYLLFFAGFSLAHLSEHDFCRLCFIHSLYYLF